MGKIRIFPKSTEDQTGVVNSLPSILQTPNGFALLEIQGTLNSTYSKDSNQGQPAIPIGKISFPLYDTAAPSSDTAWQKKVHLIVGDNQRLTGELKKLPNPIAILRKKSQPEVGQHDEELEIAEIIYYKLMFSQRPEPFSTIQEG